MVDSILDAMKGLWDWVINAIKEIINALLEPLADKIPDMSYDLGCMGDALAFANTWVALDWAFYLLSAYFVYIIVMILIKLTVKLFVPFVG